jgi:hypothetical protein
VPAPGQEVVLQLDWPEDAEVKSLRVRYQTSVAGPWIESPQQWEDKAPRTAKLGTFERETPVSYRVDAELKNGAKAELWGYLQVRTDANRPVQPHLRSTDLIESAEIPTSAKEVERWSDKQVDVMAMIDPAACWHAGTWAMVNGRLQSPKQFGARLELPYSPPEEYRLVMIVEPLDEPNGLILGQRSGARRFVTLFDFRPRGEGLSAVEDVNGRNVGNETTYKANLFRKNRPAQVVVTVKKGGVTMVADGRTIVDWKGSSDALSLSEYWKTPNEEALFIGAYNCRYLFHRITLEPITGEGKRLTLKKAN